MKGRPNDVWTPQEKDPYRYEYLHLQLFKAA